MTPLDAFTGKKRLLDVLEDAFRSQAYESAFLATAFATSAPLRHLEPAIRAFRAAQGTARALIGIDRNVTSLEALQLALEIFDDVHIVHTSAPLAIFHPKLYIFRGARSARCIVGSNNLTSGGLQTNLEAAVDITFALPSEEAEFDPVLCSWMSFLPASCELSKRLTATLLAQLSSAKLVLPETTTRTSTNNGSKMSSATSPAAALGFPGTFPAPPRSLPRLTGTSAPSRARSTRERRGKAPSSPAASQTGQTLVIQIRPHDNGEILLSKTAVDQNPAFFDRPWTGKTVPKKATNQSYEQRTPDFVVDISVYDRTGAQVAYEASHNLNTVYYTKKHEVRITVPPSVRDAAEDMAILVMSANPASGVEYEMTIINPGSPSYAAYLATCNQTLPTGGKAVGRRMGWA